MNKFKWISVYVFYTNTDYLLKEAVQPFFNTLKDIEGIKENFFIRYNVGGPHIRIRILVESIKEVSLKNALEVFFEDFLKKNPSNPPKISGKLKPNNSLFYEEYIPEIGRYGGENTISLAENHFHESTKITLSVISKYDNWNISIAQILAIQLYTVFFRNIIINNSSLEKMLHIMNNNHWTKRAQSIANVDDIKGLFLKSYKKNEDIIIQAVQALEDVINDPNEDLNKELNTFAKSINELDQDLDKLSNKNLIFFDFEGKTFEKNTSDNKARIYISYLHMLNNRLGLANHDEAYMSFVLEKLILNKVI